MNSSKTPHKGPLLIAQVEPPQKEDGGDYYYRTYSPGIAMAMEEGVHVINLTNVHRRKEEIMDRADILVLKNICDPDVLPLIKERKQHNRLTVYELADDLCAIPPWNPVHFFYKQEENLLLFKRIASYCDAMQFSVPELKRLYGYLNPFSEIFTNQVSIIPQERTAEEPGEIIIGWGDSHGHLEDMEEVADPLIDCILARDNVRIHLMCSESIRTIFDRLPSSKKLWVRPGSLEKYYEFLKGIHIGLAPLKDTAFNRSRSDVKFLEYAVCGVLPVVRDLVPYASTIRHNETGFLYKDPVDLLRILETLIDNTHTIPSLARNAREYVIKERLQLEHAADRTEFYRTRLAGLCDRQVMNGGHSIFDSLSGIEGAVCTNRHLRLKPTRFEDLLHDGLVLSQVRDETESANSHFSEASRLEPDNYLPYLFGASCSGDATQALEKAVEKNPRSIKSLILLGDEYARSRDIERSIRCFETAVKIFPEYEVPYIRTARIVRSFGKKYDWLLLLDKAQSCLSSLGDRPLENRGDSHPTLSNLNQTKRVLLLASANGMIHHDCIYGFKALGWDTSVESFGSGTHDEPDAHERLVFRIQSYQPHMVLSINHVGCDQEGYIPSALRQAGIPLAIWYVDNPFALLPSDIKVMIGDASLLLSFDSSYVNELQDQTGVTAVHLPLGTNPERFYPLGFPDAQPEMDISFVGNLGIDMLHHQRLGLEKNNPGLGKLVDRISDSLISGNSDTGEFSFKTLAQSMDINWNLLSPELQNHIRIASDTDASVRKRISIVSSLRKFNIKVVGGPEWEQYLPPEHLLPPVGYLNGLCAVYRNSRISLNITRLQLRSGVNQRIFDVPATGSFLLTDRSPELENYLQPGEEVGVYENAHDIKDKVGYYLSHNNEMKKITERARDRVLKEHTYQHRVSKIIGLIGLS